MCIYDSNSAKIKLTNPTL